MFTPTCVRAARVVVLLCLMGELACGEVASRDGSTKLDAGREPVEAFGDARTFDGAEEVALQASLTATRARLCSGECSTLRASARGGTAPYLFTWNEGLPSYDGPHQACPSVTTVYRVVVNDSSGALEFPRAQVAEASFTLEVDPACRDAGTLPQPPEGDTCRAFFPVRASTAGSAPQVEAAGSHALALDVDGNSYLGASFRGSLDLLGRSVVSTEAPSGPSKDAFIVKIDPQCRPLWSRHLGPVVNADAISSDGTNVFLGGAADGNVDFGAGPTAVAGALVAKWDGAGKVLWAQSYGSGIVRSVANDAEGNLLFTVEGPTAMDFGGGPVRRDISALGFAVVKLSAQGKHVFTHALPIGTSSAWVSAAADRTVYVGGTTVLAAGSARQYGLRLSAEGQVLAALQMMPNAALDDPGRVDRATVDALGNFVLSRDQGGEGNGAVIGFSTLRPALSLVAAGHWQLGGAHSMRPYALAAYEGVFALAAPESSVEGPSARGPLRLAVHHVGGDLVSDTLLTEGGAEWPLGLAFIDRERVVIASLRASEPSAAPNSLVLTRIKLP